MTPTCPANYKCLFTPEPPQHFYAHWWDGAWGVWIAILALIAVAVVLSVIAYYVSEARRSHHETTRTRIKQEAEERQAAAERNHELLMAEQLTMQLDTAKDNPELLTWVDRHRPSS